MKKPRILCLLLASLFLTACSNNASPHTVGGAAIGAVTGATIGGIAFKSSHAALGGLIGALLGGAVGAYYDQQGILDALQKEGITVIKLGDTVRVVIPADIIFNPTETRIRQDSYPLLDQVVTVLYQYPGVNLNVIGHTDDVGTESHQLLFSRLQAQSLATYLWTKGIDLSRIQVFGVGAKDTDATLRGVYGAAYNRRVEIIFWRRKNPGIGNSAWIFSQDTCANQADMEHCQN